MTLIPFGRRFTELAEADPDRPSVTCGDVSLTRAELDAAANRLARDDASRGVKQGDMVTIALPNSVDWYVAAIAAWKVGAIPQPVSARLPGRELAAIVELADAVVVMGVDPDMFPDRVCLPVGYQAPAELDDSTLPDIVSPSWKAPTSGGSTGRPKLIVSGDPGMFDTEGFNRLRLIPDRCMVMPGPLYHNAPAVWSCQALLYADHVVLLPRFDAEATLATIERYQGDITYLVPTMMKRIWRLPEEVRDKYDLSSLRIVWHVAEPCPPWLKEAWINWLGPERIMELYGGTEAQLTTIISGEEWLTHRGSVGRPITGEMFIADAEGNPLPNGQMGEVWTRPVGRATPTYRYIGAEPRAREGGWESLGDMGWVDDEGYLYLGDRASDMILTGGSNVYPAEVEAAIQEHPDVRSCVVIGLPDDDMGNRVHAIVEADPDVLKEADLLDFLGERLARYKLPRSMELVDEPLRDDAGKVRRSALRAERLAAAQPDGAPPA